jgi:hypothetical protein
VNAPDNLPASRFYRTIKISFVLLLLSFGSAIFLANSGMFWSFISWLPRSFTEGLIGFLNSIFAPIQQVEVHAQEENLEFLTAWCFSIVAFIMLYLSFAAIKRAFHAHNTNAL